MECESSGFELATGAKDGKTEAEPWTPTTRHDGGSSPLERCQTSDSDRDHLDTQGQATLALGSHDNVAGAMATLVQSGPPAEAGDQKEMTGVASETEPVARQPTVYLPLWRAPDVQVMKGALPFIRFCYDFIEVNNDTLVSPVLYPRLNYLGDLLAKRSR